MSRSPLRAKVEEPKKEEPQADPPKAPKWDIERPNFRMRFLPVEEPKADEEPIKPDIVFQKPPIARGRPPFQTPEYSQYRYDNDELRWTVKEIYARLQPEDRLKGLQFADLTEFGNDPPLAEDQLLDENWELNWRVRQLKRIFYSYPTEDESQKGTRPPAMPKIQGCKPGDPFCRLRQ